MATNRPASSRNFASKREPKSGSSDSTGSRQSSLTTWPSCQSPDPVTSQRPPSDARIVRAGSAGWWVSRQGPKPAGRPPSRDRTLPPIEDELTDHLGESGSSRVRVSFGDGMAFFPGSRRRRRRAASTVLRRSIATVSGPTPPGTGVIQPATGRHVVEGDVAHEDAPLLVERGSHAR